MPRLNREAMILDNMVLVRTIASTLRDSVFRNVDLEDLVSAGTIGLIEAVDDYDASRNVAFGAFARHRIRGAILDSTSDWYKQPVHYGPIQEPRPFPNFDTRALQLDQAVDTLDLRSQAIVKLYYQDGLTLEEIGERFDIHKMRVKQLLDKALATLRDHITSCPKYRTRIA